MDKNQFMAEWGAARAKAAITQDTPRPYAHCIKIRGRVQVMFDELISPACRCWQCHLLDACQPLEPTKENPVTIPNIMCQAVKQLATREVSRYVEEGEKETFVCVIGGEAFYETSHPGNLTANCSLTKPLYQPFLEIISNAMEFLRGNL